MRNLKSQSNGMYYFNCSRMVQNLLPGKQNPHLATSESTIPWSQDCRTIGEPTHVQQLLLPNKENIKGTKKRYYVQQPIK